MTTSVSHSLEEAARQLSRKLAPRARHIVLLLGAGASCSAGLPDLAGLQKSVSEKLDGTPKAVFDKLTATLNLEGILSRLRLVAAALEGTTETIDGLSAKSAVETDAAICKKIREI